TVLLGGKVLGRCFHWIPVCSTKRIASKTSRSPARGRPYWLLRGRSKSGPSSSHCSSLINIPSLSIPHAAFRVFGQPLEFLLKRYPVYVRSSRSIDTAG